MFWERALYIDVYPYIYTHKELFSKPPSQKLVFDLQTNSFEMALIVFWKRALHI